MYPKFKNKEKRKLYLKRWRQNNKEKIEQYYSIWRNNHKEYHNEWYRKNHPIIHFKKDYPKEKIYSDFFKYASPVGRGSIQRNGLNAKIVYEYYNKKCVYCGKEFDLTIHHLDGKGRNYLNRGLKPNNDFGNLILLCRSCHGKIHSHQPPIK